MSLKSDVNLRKSKLAKTFSKFSFVGQFTYPSVSVDFYIWKTISSERDYYDLMVMVSEPTWENGWNRPKECLWSIFETSIHDSGFWLIFYFQNDWWPPRPDWWPFKKMIGDPIGDPIGDHIGDPRRGSLGVTKKIPCFRPSERYWRSCFATQMILALYTNQDLKRTFITWHVVVQR